MKAIQCFSSLPLLRGRLASGLYDGGKPELELPDSVLLCMRLSALQWRRLNGPIKLYTDTPMKRYLSEKGLLDCWDSVDTSILDAFCRDCSDIDLRVFWSAGKFACYQHERAPFVCIDTDLIVWKRLDFAEGLDFAFAHWEKIEPDDESYPSLDRIQRTDMEKAELSPDCFGHYACNMAITYLGNDLFRETFVRHAFAFMRRNTAKPDGRYALPDILYMEQRLPYALARKMQLNYAPVLACTWNPKQFRIMHPGKEFKNWFFSDLDHTKPFTHLWFHKKYLAENPAAAAAYCENLRREIAQAERRHHRSPQSGNAWRVSHLLYDGKGCHEQGCSRCGYSFWLSDDDPDFTEDMRDVVKGSSLRFLYCAKYPGYWPIPPYYRIGLSDCSSMGN